MTLITKLIVRDSADIDYLFFQTIIRVLKTVSHIILYYDINSLYLDR